MKTKLFAIALATLTLATAGSAAAQNYRGDRSDRGRYEQNDRGRYEQNDWRHRGTITVRRNGANMQFDRGDRMFHRLIDRPFNFRPGLIYSYTDRCNRSGCVVFVFDGRYRRPVDRIFAPHMAFARSYNAREQRGYNGRDNGGFDNYNRYGRYDRDDRNWNNEDDRNYRNQRDGRGDRDRERDDRRN